MSKGLKNVFLAHAIVALLFGLPLLLVPETYERLTNWDPIEPAIARTLGAALLAFTVSSWLAYRAETWSEVRIVVAHSIGFTTLGVAASLYQVLGPGAPAMIWLNIAVMAVFWAFWVYYYRRGGM